MNDSLWDSTLYMTSVKNFLDVATHSSWFGDIYAAEMFHNYKMSERLQPNPGVDVPCSDKGGELHWERWTWMDMGLASSPFATIRIFLVP